MMNITKPVRTVGNILTTLAQTSVQSLKLLLSQNNISSVALDGICPSALAWSDGTGKIHSGMAQKLCFENDMLFINVCTPHGDSLLSERDFPPECFLWLDNIRDYICRYIDDSRQAV